jgi:nitroreductase
MKGIMNILKVIRNRRSFNSQPWEFVIIRNKETLKSISKYARYSGYLEAVPMAIAVVVPPINTKFSWVEGTGETKYAAAMAVQNIMLAAWEMGIGTCWVSIDRDKVGDILNKIFYEKHGKKS